MIDLRQLANLSNVVSIAGYIPILIGFWIEFQVVKEAINKRDLIKTGILTLIPIVLSVYYIIIPAIFDRSYSFLGKVIYLSFQLGDVLIIFSAILFFYVFQKGKVTTSWLIVAMAMGFGAIAGISFSYLSWNGLYAGIPLVLTQMAWIVDYILLSFGAYYHRLILKGEI